MKVTKAMREYAVKNLGVAENANDTDVKAAFVKGIESGDITAETLFMLGSPNHETSQGAIKSLMKEMVAEAINDPEFKRIGATKISEAFGGRGELEGERIDVLPALRRYKSLRLVGKHATIGEPVQNEHRQDVLLSSEADHVRMGVWFKHLARGTKGVSVVFNEHEQAILSEMIEHDTFAGVVRGEPTGGIKGREIKSLLSDSLSGGSNINPLVWDNAVVTYPLLNSEILPRVDLVPLSRGSHVETAALNNVEVQWGAPEGTAAVEFDTSDLLSKIEADVFPVMCVLTVGRDLMNDSPVKIGALLEERIGEKFAQEIDRVLAVGNGTSQPQGLFSASGIASFTPAGGAGADPEVDDYETLLFGVDKAYRKNSAFRCAFVSNDVTYSRLRGIPVSSSDARRIFGVENYQSYETLAYPHLIQNDIPNASIMFGALNRMRAWRRNGVEFQIINGDYQLARQNLIGIIVRARWGGKVVDPNCFIKSTTFKA